MIGFARRALELFAPPPAYFLPRQPIPQLGLIGEQRRRAVAGAFNPTRPALYRDPELLAARPEMARLLPILESAVARPSRFAGTAYNRVSSTFWQAVHAVLSGREAAADALAGADRRIARILARRRR